MTQTAVDIRLMQAADLPAVLEIQAVCHTEAAHESRESLKAKFSASHTTCFIASFDRNTVGYLISLPWKFLCPPVWNAESCRLPSSPDCLYLHDLAVIPGARKSGAARVLVQAFFDRQRVLGLGRASLVAVQNYAPYWERFGFRTVPLSEPLKATLSSYGAEAEYMERAIGS
jgi:predicted N-acetyltransferase YhbS